jgi:hypothetical protein
MSGHYLNGPLMRAQSSSLQIRSIASRIAVAVV